MNRMTAVLALSWCAATTAAAQPPVDCATALRSIVPAGQSTDPSRYAAGNTAQQGEITGSLEFLSASSRKELFSNSVECQTRSAEATVCWVCGRDNERNTRCLKTQCLETDGASGSASRLGGGGIYNDGTIHLARIADPATLQLVRSKRQGRGQMIVEVERGSELASLLRFQLKGAPHRPLARVRIGFTEAITSETGIPTAANATSATLEDIVVIKILDKSRSASRPTEEVAFYYNKITW
jgi:hypothetical protein